jgi:hypothetical protein
MTWGMSVAEDNFDIWGWVKTLVPLVNPKIAGKWMFIPLKMVLIGIDPYPYVDYRMIQMIFYLNINHKSHFPFNILVMCNTIFIEAHRLSYNIVRIAYSI